jgi:hypothetical protein
MGGEQLSRLAIEIKETSYETICEPASGDWIEFFGF